MKYNSIVRCSVCHTKICKSFDNDTEKGVEYFAFFDYCDDCFQIIQPLLEPLEEEINGIIFAPETCFTMEDLKKNERI